jgi:hypothetical protein
MNVPKRYNLSEGKFSVVEDDAHVTDHAAHLNSGSNGNFSFEWTKGCVLALAQLDLSYSDFDDIYEDINHLIE